MGLIKCLNNALHKKKPIDNSFQTIVILSSCVVGALTGDFLGKYLNALDTKEYTSQTKKIYIGKDEFKRLAEKYKLTWTSDHNYSERKVTAID